MQSTEASARVDVARLTKLLFLCFILPVLIGLSLDLLLGLTPLLTFIVGVLSIVLSTFVVVRAAVAEFDRVVHELAPEPPADEPPSV